MRLVAELSKTAQDLGLPDALIDLWDEMRPYPLWALRDDFKQLNCLAVEDISESSEEGTTKIAFSRNGVRYSISGKSYSGYDYEKAYFDISLEECGEEVFAITAELVSSDWRPYRFSSVSAFKRNGTWANMLIDCASAIRLKSERMSLEMRTHMADEARKRFSR